MIHFFPRFARDVSNTPFACELREVGVPHRLFAEALNRQYRSRAGLLLRVYPLLLFCAVRAAVRSMVLATPKPDAVVVTSDIEAVVFGLLRMVVSRRTLVVFETFIATERVSPWARRLHHWHYSLVLRFVDVAICHSAVEARAYTARFASSGARFAALPYALSVNGREALCAEHGAAAAEGNVIVAAGRSGRDYATLATAISGLPVRLRVICDWERPTRGIEGSPQITLVRNCFKADYLTELAQARIVVVPLSQRAVSAGQMVLLQAAALGKPVIITDTPTTREYVSDGNDALLCRFADPADLRRQIEFLLADPARGRNIGQRASANYDARFSTEAYVRGLVRLLRDEIAARTPPIQTLPQERSAQA